MTYLSCCFGQGSAICEDQDPRSVTCEECQPCFAYLIYYNLLYTYSGIPLRPNISDVQGMSTRFCLSKKKLWWRHHVPAGDIFAQGTNGVYVRVCVCVRLRACACVCAWAYACLSYCLAVYLSGCLSVSLSGCLFHFVTILFLFSVLSVVQAAHLDISVRTPKRTTNKNALEEPFRWEAKLPAQIAQVKTKVTNMNYNHL